MRFLFLAALVLVSTFYVAESQYLPEVLIHRARDLIQRAEYDLHQHHQRGRSHLTQELEHEIQRVRVLVKELEVLEHSRHMVREQVHQVEERLLHHENQLAELSAQIEANHAIEERNREEHLLGGY